ncbi:carbonic anhydrase, partial [Marinobacter antarcticus]
DFNCLSVLQFAVEVLKVKHILVVGHYGCGGIRAAYRNEGFGLISNWLRHVQDVRDRHQAVLDASGSEFDQIDRLCELNVIEQVGHLCQNNIVQDAWKRGQTLNVHGFVYDVADGILRDMGLSVSGAEDWEQIKENSLSELILRPVRSGREKKI